MLADRRAAHGKSPGDVAGSARALGQPAQHLAPDRVSNGRQNLVDLRHHRDEA
jgi:hypothetical protein